MPGIGVISNRNARLNKLYPKIKDRMAFVVGRSGELVSTGSLDDTRQTLEAFMDADIDMLAISGGDGTAHRTIEIAIDVYGEHELPPILLLPTGTQNMVPNSLGIRNSGVSTLLLAQAYYRHNLPMKCLRRNMLKVNDHYSFMLGIGIAPRFLEEYYKRGDTTHLGAAKLVGEYALGAFRKTRAAEELVAPMNVSYRVDGAGWRSKVFHTIFCSFVEELSLRFKVFPRAGWEEGLFEFYAMEGPAYWVAKIVPQLWIGSLRRLKGVSRSLCRSVEIQLERAEPYTLDGEIYEPQDKFSISAGPELKFVIPGIRFTRTDPRLRYDTIGPWEMRFLV